MDKPDKESSGKPGHWIYRPYITTRDGRRIYPKNGRVFRIWVED